MKMRPEELVLLPYCVEGRIWDGAESSVSVCFDRVGTDECVLLATDFELLLHFLFKAEESLILKVENSNLLGMCLKGRCLMSILDSLPN